MRRKTRVLFAALLGLVLALGALSGLTLTAYADPEPVLYDLWVGDVQVTSANAGDVLGTADVGETVKFDPNSTTLTLNGAVITTGYAVKYSGPDSTEYYGIYYAGQKPLTIVVASDSTVDVSGIEDGDFARGVVCNPSDLTITGEGKLTAKGRDNSDGISALYNVTIDKGVVDASGGESGIQAREGAVVINGSTVKTEGSINGKAVEVNGSTVDASGYKWGIFADSVTINGGKVTATASDDDGNGINANSQNEKPGTVTISGGTVSATGGANGHGIYAEGFKSDDDEVPGMPGTVTISGGTVSATGGDSGYGIYTNMSRYSDDPGTVKISGDIASVTISGGTQAVKGDVSNAVAGMGWTDVEGKTGKAIIPTNTEAGQALSYMKVQFPVPVAKVTAPRATNPTYDGKAQELVTGGSAEGGTMQYSLDGKTFSKEVPTGTEPKSYTVWYKAVGDESHGDTESQSVESTIAKADPTVTAPKAMNPTYTGEAQALVEAGTAEGGEMQYSLDGKTYSKDIPTGTDVGTYTVWYKVIGDGNHNDTEAKRVDVTIGPKPAVTYKITVAPGITGGAVEVDEAAAAGATVTVRATADEGYELASVTVTDADGKAVEVKGNSFTMPAKDVTVSATFAKKGSPEPGKPIYAVTSGSGSEWAEGSDGKLTFVFKRSEGDEETFRRFKSASVDGKLLTKDRDYRATAGSVVIELQPAYLATLAAGEHTLTATFDDGGTADAKFTVSAAASERDYPSPSMSNSRGGNITSRADAVTYTVTQKVPEWATSVRIWVDLESVLALTHDPAAIRVATADGVEVPGAKASLEGGRLTVEVADATALRGKTITFSYTAKLKDGADLTPYLNEAKNVASVPYKAFTVFDGDESHVAVSATEYVKFSAGASKSGGTTPATAAKPTLPKTGDPAPLAAVAMLAATGATFAAVGMRRGRRDQ